MDLVLCIVLGYLLGSLNPAALIGKIKHFNLRKHGTGNLGATNVLLNFGKGFAAVVMLFDIFKAFAAFHLAALFCGGVELAPYLAGAAAVLGHIFPFYLKFKGGKGFASYLGMTIALNWKLALVILLIVVLVTLITDYIVVGTVTTVLSVPTYLGITSHSWILAAILCVATVVILYKHRENYVRIYNGTELGFRGVSKGKHRVK